VEGLTLGSREILFTPGKLRGGRYFFDVGTAGSTTLVLQALMPLAAFTPEGVEIEIIGGTNNPMAPPVEFFQEILLPIISKMGYRGRVELLRRGFYPRGGGRVKAFIEPVKTLSPIEYLERGEVTRILGLSYSCRLPSHIVERMAKTAAQILKASGIQEVEVREEALQPGDPLCSPDPGCGIFLHTDTREAYLASDSLGRIGKPAERVASEAAEDLVKQISTQAPIDRHLGDQLIVYMSLARGRSRIRVSELTMHTLTVIEVSEKIIGARFQVDGDLNKPATITCEGIGLENEAL